MTCHFIFYKSDNESMVWWALQHLVRQRMQPSDEGTGLLVSKPRHWKFSVQQSSEVMCFNEESRIWIILQKWFSH